MMPNPGFSSAVISLALCAGLSGCLSGERHGSTPNRSPAMPTVALPSAPSVTSTSDKESLVAALRAARSNDIPGVVQVMRSIGDPSQRAAIAAELMAQLSGHDP